ncbi:amidohydrolase [Candidatus Bathyarchaeota archaeon]|nr:MAG: amidohydrolase [Candidatus Bathyarchaeota archaeon]
MLPKPILDIHTHLGKIFRAHPRLSARGLLRKMDSLGIDMAVVLAIENPEETDYYFPTESVLRATRKYRDRLIPFCNVDPRRGHPKTFDPYPIIERYVARGCRGFGEELAGLFVDDERLQRIYRAVAELGIPILLHLDGYRNIDDVGLPRFERMIREHKRTIFIAHGPHWWAEISGDVKPEDVNRYPKGPVKPGGKVEYLLQKYPNVYGDLSAGSGLNALQRDPEHAKGFLERNRRKLLFGTDIIWETQEIKTLEFLEKLELDENVYRDILYRNAEKLLKL